MHRGVLANWGIADCLTCFQQRGRSGRCPAEAPSQLICIRFPPEPEDVNTFVAKRTRSAFEAWETVWYNAMSEEQRQNLTCGEWRIVGWLL